jgi:hypothetical protein
MLRQAVNRLREHWILLPILCIGTALRTWELTKIGLRGDEAVYAGQALILAGHQEMRRFFVLASRGVNNFLLHQGLQALIYSALGVSDLTTRLLPMTFSMLTVVVVYLLGRELFDRWIGAVAAFLLAINGYAVSLGRLALLDSTMTFFVTLSMLWLAKWARTGEPRWAYLLAGTAGLAVMAKTPAVLVIPISLLVVVVTKRLGDLNLRTVAGSTLAFTVCVSPAILQFASNPSLLTAFLLQGSSRVSRVPATYYIDKLVTFAGPIFLVTTILGVAVALVCRKKGDLMCLIWAATVIVFFQAYPLKGFNYILPLVPTASILAGRGLVSLARSLSLLPSLGLRVNPHRRGEAITVMAMILLLAPASYSLGYASLHTIVYDRPFVGLREAAYWLRDNAPPGAAAMTISQGSAQYVLSFYAKIDAYPFGDFRLHTVLPGGGIILGAPPPDPLIQNGTVTYLVHYVSWGGDDPIHMPMKRPIEERFMELIRKYQGKLLHTVYYQFTGLDGTEIREKRVWIYKVGKRLPKPEVEVSLDNTTLHVTGVGFLIDSHVDIYYGGTLLGRFPTDDMGCFTASIRFPQRPVQGAELLVLDPKRNYVSTPLERDFSDGQLTHVGEGT